MRLWELFEDISPAEIKDIEHTLDDLLYQPPEKVKRNQPVIDLDLPTGRSHFMQRIIQRADKANITAREIQHVLARAKTDPSMGVADKINAASKIDNPQDDILVRDPDTDLTIPMVVVPNQSCEKTTDGIAVCKTPVGKAPKNKIVAKTIYRKGVED